MKVHALQTGTVAVKSRQQRGVGHGIRRQVNTLLDRAWTEPLPIFAWVIEHPEGLIMVDTGETARTAQPGYFPRWHPYFLPQHWPSWFAPRPITFNAGPVGPFSRSYPLTQAGDVVLIPTPGHTPGHLSVIVREGDTALFLAGDTSYTEGLILEGAIDGVAPDEAAYRLTSRRIVQYLRSVPTVYLPSHDPASAARLAARQIAVLKRAPES